MKESDYKPVILYLIHLLNNLTLTVAICGREHRKKSCVLAGATIKKSADDRCFSVVQQ